MTGSPGVVWMSNSCSCDTSRSPCSSSMTSVKFRSLAAWLTRWMRCSSNSANASPNLCRMPRILRPTSDSAAQGPITSARQRSARLDSRASMVDWSRVLACGSSDTVTLVSEVETRSTLSPCCLKTWKASARKPTWCHIPGLSMETSVMPFLRAMAFTRAASAPAGEALMTVPGISGVWVA